MSKPEPAVNLIRTAHMCAYYCAEHVRNTAQNSSDNFSSLPDSHHCCSDVYWRRGEPEPVMCVLQNVTKLQLGEWLDGRGGVSSLLFEVLRGKRFWKQKAFRHGSFFVIVR